MGKTAKYQKLLERAAISAQNGRFPQAISSYLVLAKQFPENPEISLQLAHALGLSGQRKAAKKIHLALWKTLDGAPDLLVRIARDLEEWQDYHGALELWSELSTYPSKYQSDARFHQVRLLERTNQEIEAIRRWSSVNWNDNNTWGRHWLAGRLSQRSGDLGKAREEFEKALALAHGESIAKCTSALARLADQMGDYEDAYKWVMETVSARSDEAEHMKLAFPMSQEAVELPAITEVNSMRASGERPVIFLTGMPRSGTTLLAHKLADRFSVDLSEEFDYIKQLVDNSAFQKSPMTPDKLVGKPSNKKYIAAYWRAQHESGLTDQLNGHTPLLDKNPSLALLAPWLLALFPNLKILWVERDPRDLWISSVMLDAPVNGATCMWQNPEDYGKWCAQQAELRERLNSLLPPEQFIKVDYQSLVSQPDSVLTDIAQRFSLEPNESRATASHLVTSPSYEEVVKPIAKNRVERWKNYRLLLSDVERKAFDQLPELYQYKPH
ncbi:hypothetical protein NT6N_33990 [Oceaniferula spumae]|uniref:Sulfotransferase family protein n=1 Tax=Oceaniferula spumae TaxID=2979115 RepID=A0AAT9FR33_9BACT